MEDIGELVLYGLLKFLCSKKKTKKKVFEKKSFREVTV